MRNLPANSRGRTSLGMRLSEACSINLDRPAHSQELSSRIGKHCFKLGWSGSGSQVVLPAFIEPAIEPVPFCRPDARRLKAVEYC